MKTLIIDIETSPVLAKVWGLWKQNIGLEQIEEDWFIMSFAAKWLDAPEVMYQDCRDYIDDYENPDFKLLENLHALLDEADFVVAHNGDKFDIKKINARFILNDFEPPSTYRTIDTLKIAKKHFAFTSNKLAFLTGKLCEDQKLDHGKFAGFKLWKECLMGNEEAWQEMEDYNIMDVVSLEELYLKLRPWFSSHPNVNTDEEAAEGCSCSKCGGTELQKRGFYYTNKGKYQRYKCTSCGGWSSGGSAVNTIESRRQLLTAR
jgi:hypothetical protein